MNELHRPNREFLSLLWAVCDGTATCDQRNELDRTLQGNTSAQRNYLRFVGLVVDLASEGNANGKSFPSTVALPKSLGLVPKSPRPAAFLSRSLSPPVMTTLMACAFYGIFVLLAWNLRPSSGPQQEHPGASYALDDTANGTQGITEEAISVVATLTNMQDCVWQPNSEGEQPRIGKRFLTNQSFELVSGVARFTLTDGAAVVIEGPAQVKLESSQYVRVHRGKLMAHVPKKASGFTVATPTAEVVDLGTEFGVEVQPSGAMGVWVFAGQVEVNSVDDTDASKGLRLTKGQAARVAAGDTRIERDNSAPPQFARMRAMHETATAAQSDYEVVFHYRLGDEDAQAQPGVIGNEQTMASPGSTSPMVLHRIGTPRYTSETPSATSSLALQFSGKGAEGYVAKGFEKLPHDNWVLEAWVRTHSSGRQVVASVGNSWFDGYGLCVCDGHWGAFHGGQAWMSSLVACQVNRWTHLAFVQENSRGQLFIDRRPEGAPCLASPEVPEPVVRLGHASLEPWEAFDGELDEVRLLRLTRSFRPEMLLYRQGK